MLFAEDLFDFGYTLFSATDGLTMAMDMESYLQDWEKELKST